MSLHIRGDASQKDLAFYTNYFSQLVGATITGFELAKDTDGFDDYWPTFTVRMKDGSVREIELSQDEEGNGPGWIFGLDVSVAQSREEEGK
jgi:hypothetical protein